MFSVLASSWHYCNTACCCCCCTAQGRFALCVPVAKLPMHFRIATECSAQWRQLDETNRLQADNLPFAICFATAVVALRVVVLRTSCTQAPSPLLWQPWAAHLSIANLWLISRPKRCMLTRFLMMKACCRSTDHLLFVVYVRDCNESVCRLPRRAGEGLRQCTAVGGEGRMRLNLASLGPNSDCTARTATFSGDQKNCECCKGRSNKS